MAPIKLFFIYLIEFTSLLDHKVCFRHGEDEVKNVILTVGISFTNKRTRRRGPNMIRNLASTEGYKLRRREPCNYNCEDSSKLYRKRSESVS